MKCLIEYIKESKEVQIKQKAEIEKFFKDNYNKLIKMFNPDGHILNTRIEYDDDDKSYAVKTNKAFKSVNYYYNPQNDKISFYKTENDKEIRCDCDLDQNFIKTIKYVYKNTGLDKVVVSSII